ncbi:carbohydrate kinase family protein [Paenibacillus sp. Soil724D2]|uniref:carbohydrate kinase family protein n=1 Tax=Paenibacillus sp. (strain Soil724D2) TaxID=1736392 RepID=UPI000712EC79|nr:carbohydrate kinase [Paenibacillus sp. Soil724D2]KRE48426.1 fructokinase [Paenibacillus sp. Soil724D2]
MFEFSSKVELPNNKINDLLTVGELLIDMIASEYDHDYHCNTYNRFFGGSPSNIAMNVKKLGIHSLVVLAVGQDGLGSYLINQLQQADMDTSYVQRVEPSTSMVVLTKSTSSPVPIFYRGADYHLTFTPELERALSNSKIVHFSSWPVSMMPVRLTIERVLEETRKMGLLVCFDPNYHPMIWSKDEDGVEYVKKLIGRVDIIKPSEDDAERLFGADTPERQIEKFLQLGAKLVIMTLGKDGAIVSNGTEMLTFDTLATEVVDTTGAGDAFWSGFYAALVQGCTVKEALTLGFAVSAYKLKFTGAVVDLPKLERIKEIYGL